MMLALALLLDAAFGEPRWLWSRLTHPAVLIGNAIGWADRRFNHGAARRLKGVLLTGALVLGGVALGGVIEALGALPTVLVAAVLLAQRSLADHVRAVARALRLSTTEGRRSVAMIVGRDTTQMEPPAIARAAIESGAENLSDGVIAPAFWFLIAGLPGMLAYKAVNTADSMIGYRTPRHEAFGWAAARLDDLLNLVPARLTALLLVLASGRGTDWRALRADARLHRSPNAGWPEAAMARALGIALSGPRSYHGEMQDLPWVNETGRRDAAPGDIDRAVMMLWKAWGVMLFVAILGAAL
ncbi:adenosylcobinamide-phosphate synthase CbiB [Pseudooceanicola onchidii]|uniref:adenosylcobinamide-phosphate synthase CbiB n=1 Tax=Pseudooceanicola onchidii TaxID=2562279 RepID=UPI003B82F34B